MRLTGRAAFMGDMMNSYNLENLTERDNFENIGVDRRKILKGILNKA
jgi:hypothetical protein